LKGKKIRVIISVSHHKKSPGDIFELSRVRSAAVVVVFVFALGLLGSFNIEEEEKEKKKDEKGQ
jgi:hypothetical protein